MAIVGAVTTLTVSVALAVLPVPPLVEVTAEVVLVLSPGLVPVTLIENVQEAPAARVAPARLTPPLPAVAVIAPPPHAPVRPLGVATRSPAGNASVNATPVSAVTALGLLIVKLTDDVPPGVIDEGVRLLAIAGGTNAFTPSVALATLPVPPLVEVTFPVTLVLSPGTAEVTLIEIVQEAPAVRVAPERLTLLPPEIGRASCRERV